MKIIIGIDVGGTHTDCVAMLYSHGSYKIMHSLKVKTKDEVQESIYLALKLMKEKVLNLDKVVAIHLGTTFVTNSIAKMKNMGKVLALRLTPYLYPLPPCYHFPKEYQDAIVDGSIHIKGGREIDGKALQDFSINNLNLEKGSFDAISITSPFSKLYPEDEVKIQKMLKLNVPICLSKDFDGDSFYTRESHTLLNASLIKSMEIAFQGVEDLIISLGLKCPIYFTDNLSTKIPVSEALTKPLSLIGSGPSNSLRGAAFLAQKDDMIVIDIGGTTMDIGRIRKGVPCPGVFDTKVGNISLSIESADIISLPFGGGSIIEKEKEEFVLSDQSLHDLKESSISFGGKVMTLTDLAIQRGDLHINGASKVKLCRSLDSFIESRILPHVRQSVDECSEGEKLPVYLVGGGASILSKYYPVLNHFPFANAIGASIAESSISKDEIIELAYQKKHLSKMQSDLYQKLQEKGICKSQIRTLQKKVTHLPYLEGMKGKASVKLMVRNC